MGKSMRAAIYVRLSRDTNGQTSTERQQADCLAYARDRGWQVDEATDVYADVDVSGYDRKVRRPQFERLIDNLHRYDVVVVYRLDRLTRGGAPALYGIIEDHLEPANVALASTQEPIFDTTSPMVAEILLPLLAVLARWESATIGRRIEAARRVLDQQGRWGGGRRPFGYDVVDRDNGTGRRLAVNRDEAAIVREVADRLLAGEATGTIARDMSARGVRSSVGKPMSITSWRLLLCRPTTAGYVTHDGAAVISDTTGLPVRFGEGALDADVWRRVHALLDERAATDRRPRRSRALLSGLLRCAECGYRLKPSGYRDDLPTAYQCETRRHHRAGCTGNAIVADRVHEVARAYGIAAIEQAIDDADRALAADRQRTADADRTGTITTLAQAIDTLTGQVVDLRASGASALRVASLEKRLDGLDRRYRDLLDAEQRAVDGAEVGELRELFPNADEVAATFDAFDVDEQRRVLGLVLDRIVVRKAARRGAPWDPDRVEPIPHSGIAERVVA